MNKMSLESIDNSIHEIEEKYLKPYQGDLISHYTNLNSLISIISKPKFWASNSMFLNDEDEIIHIRDNIENAIYSHFPKKDAVEYNNWVLKIFDDMTARLTKNTFIISCSTEQDYLPLWANYAPNCGCSINLSREDIESNIHTSNLENKETLIDYGVVSYDDFTKSNVLKEVLDILMILLKTTSLRSIEEVKLNDWIMPIIKRIFTRLYMFSSLTKKEIFAPEKEFRFVCNVDVKRHPSLLCFRESDGLIIPYVEVNSLFKNEKLPIKSITLGPRNNVKKVKSGLEDFFNSQGYSDIEIIPSDIHLRY
jgi:Protein of unknown function (DUF2971)